MAWESEDPSTQQNLPIFCLMQNRSSHPEDAFTGPGYPLLERSEKKRDLGTVCVITPYCPRHKRCIDRCRKIVQQAWEYSPGPFSAMVHETIFDDGHRGPGWGRNRAMENQPDADWYFFVDADDMAKRHCFEAMNWIEQLTDVVWGRVEQRNRDGEDVVAWYNVRTFREYGWGELISVGHDQGGGVNTTCFVRGDLARKFKWFERMYSYEDNEMFLCWASQGTFQRLDFPLVMVDTLTPSSNQSGKGGQFYKGVWNSMQTFWRRNARTPLPQDVLDFRNECETATDFYGV